MHVDYIHENQVDSEERRKSKLHARYRYTVEDKSIETHNKK